MKLKSVVLGLLVMVFVPPAQAEERPLGQVRPITVDDVYRLEAGMTEAEVIATLGKPWGRHEESRPHNQPDVKDLKQCMIYPVVGNVSSRAKSNASKKKNGEPVRYAIAVVLRDGKVVEWGRYGSDYSDGKFCHINSGLL